MIEFALVLLIKRGIEFQKKKNKKKCNRKEVIDRNSSNEGQNQFLLKEKALHIENNHEAQDDIESNYTNERNETEILYSTTDVIDFVSLFVFLICYITFNCIYMRVYIS